MLRRSCQSSVGKHPIANAQHNQHRNIIGLGLNRFAVGDSWQASVPPSGLPAFLTKFDCDTLEALLAALSYRKGASHDCSSTTDDRRHAGAESIAAYAGIVSPAGLAVCTLLPHVSRCIDPRAHPDLSDLPHEREEAGAQL